MITVFMTTENASMLLKTEHFFLKSQYSQNCITLHKPVTDVLSLWNEKLYFFSKDNFLDDAIYIFIKCHTHASDIGEIITHLTPSNSSWCYMYLCILSSLAQYGYKTEFPFAQIPDVDCSDERAVCSTISQVIGSSLIWASIFFRLLSVTAVVTHFTAMISPTYRTTFLHPASSSSRRVNMQISDSTWWNCTCLWSIFSLWLNYLSLTTF